MDKKESWTSSAEVKSRIHRLTVFGASVSEIFDAYSRMKGPEDWSREFRAVGKKFEDAADKIDDRYVKAANYMKATLYYYTAQSTILPDNEEKIQIYKDCARAFEKGGKYIRPAIERVEYPFMGVTMSAYFRKPADIAKPPCVITVRGIDAPKEIQDQLFAEYLLNKGMATLSIDCTGQHAARFAGLNMRPDFEKPVGAALDYLKKRNDINYDRVGIIGVSFGGFIAPRAASLEKRLKACVSVGGFYSMAEFDYPGSSKANFINDTKFTPSEYPIKKKEFTLEGIIEQMTCPLLVVNGSEDSLQPKDQSNKIFDQAKCPKDLMIYQGYGHCAYNQDKGVIAFIADWLDAKLTGKELSTTYKSHLTFTA